jgi:esterase/lipase
MRYKRYFSSLQIYFLTTVFVLFSLTACRNSPSKEPKAHKNNKIANKSSNSSDLKKVIVLLHGMATPNSKSVAKLKSNLDRDIKNAEVIILKRYNSGTVSTIQQADETYNDLMNQLTQKGLINNPICFIAHSQGGLVALTLYDKYKNNLNIKGIITSQSPLEGAPAINTSDEMLADFKKELQSLLANSENIALKHSATILKRMNLKKVITHTIHPPVIKDLTNNSTLLQNIRLTLANIQIPVLILAGSVDIQSGIMALLKFSAGDKFLPKSMLPFLEKKLFSKVTPSEMEELDKKYAAIIGDKTYDAMVPFYSQYAEHIQLSNTVERVKTINSPHFTSLIATQEAYNAMVKFINKIFEPNK